MTKSTCVIQAAVPAIPAKPKNPAMMAMTKKISAYDNITNLLFLPGFGFVLFQAVQNSSLFDVRTDFPNALNSSLTAI